MRNVYTTTILYYYIYGVYGELVVGLVVVGGYTNGLHKHTTINILHRIYSARVGTFASRVYTTLKLLEAAAAARDASPLDWFVLGV